MVMVRQTKSASIRRDGIRAYIVDHYLFPFRIFIVDFEARDTVVNVPREVVASNYISTMRYRVERVVVITWILLAHSAPSRTRFRV